MDKKAMYKMTYGLFVLTTQAQEKDYGCIINTAIQVSSDPNRISISVNKANYTHDMILKSNRFTVSSISQEADFELFKRFGFQSGRDVDKFAGFQDSFKRGYNGCPIITQGTNAFFSGWVEQAIDLGSHTLFIAGVTDMEVLSKAASASYEYYQSNIKPKPQPVKTTQEGLPVYRCRICGYEYVGELPEDYICPICKHPASDFEKVSG